MKTQNLIFAVAGPLWALSAFALDAAPIDFELPFGRGVDVICTHSSGVGSHAYPNAMYALDLATPYAEAPATIRAAADGEAFVLLGEDGKPCVEPSGNATRAESSNCGESWGNRVKIRHQDGYYSFYTHLDHALVSSGQRVRKGDAIGIEGYTGAAGHRHVHWSVQYLEDPGKILTHTGKSVPFRFRASQNGVVQFFNSATLKCPHENVGAVADQPHFRAP